MEQTGEEEEIRIPQAVVKSWFDHLLDQIIEAVQGTLDRVDANGNTVDNMLIVGGFGGSPYLIARLREAFSSQVKEVVCPGVPSQAVLKGSLTFCECVISCQQMTLGPSALPCSALDWPSLLCAT